MPLARRHLRRGQGDTDPRRALVADEVQQRTPPAAQVQHPPPGPDSDLLGDVLMFAPLSLLETQRKVTVVPRPAEIRELPQAQPNDAIDQRVGELKVLRPATRKPQAISGRETPAKTNGPKACAWDALDRLRAENRGFKRVARRNPSSAIPFPALREQLPFAFGPELSCCLLGVLVSAGDLLLELAHRRVGGRSTRTRVA